MIRPILRHPGNKWRFRAVIRTKLAGYTGWRQFREPFAGAAAISIDMLATDPQLPTWISDRHVGICCLWKAVRDHVHLLMQRVDRFVPSFEAYDQAVACLRSHPFAACDHDIVHIGFCKLAVHCLSFRGMGELHGPHGGRRFGIRRLRKRWNAEYLRENIIRLHHAISHIRITNADYSELILDESAIALLYLDPPFVEAGPTLYPHAFQDENHVTLAQLLRHTRHPWVMSYDDHPRIWELYQGWADISCIPVRYALGERLPKVELLISSR